MTEKNVASCAYCDDESCERCRAADRLGAMWVKAFWNYMQSVHGIKP